MAPTSFTGWLYDIDIYDHVISPCALCMLPNPTRYHAPNHLIVIVTLRYVHTRLRLCRTAILSYLLIW